MRHVPPAVGLLAGMAGVLLRASELWAHPGRPPAPHDLWGAWSWEPGVLLPLGLGAWMYARGTGRVWRRAGVGRGVARWRFWCFSAGLLVLFLALVSPLDALGGALFSAHMAQHELLVLVAAPLLVLGRPLVPFVWALSPAWRRRLGREARQPAFRRGWRGVTHPVTAWLLFAGISCSGTCRPRTSAPCKATPSTRAARQLPRWRAALLVGGAPRSAPGARPRGAVPLRDRRVRQHAGGAAHLLDPSPGTPPTRPAWRSGASPRSRTSSWAAC